ncbi:MAG TPA: helix-hairpin-helix domain-containing protein [Anaerolineae bacterium]|nr:helix-hairpin-helix domain-containing protein [Anaerolineae bacterium]
MYRVLRNLALAVPGGGHRIVRIDAPFDPAWVSAAGLERLLKRGYIETVAVEAAAIQDVGAAVAAADAAIWNTTEVGITGIRGIGKERAKVLAELGLGTLEALAQATPTQLEQLQDRGITAKQCAAWQAQAAALLRPAGTLATGGTCERCSSKKNARH